VTGTNEPFRDRYRYPDQIVNLIMFCLNILRYYVKIGNGNGNGHGNGTVTVTERYGTARYGNGNALKSLLSLY